MKIFKIFQKSVCRISNLNKKHLNLLIDNYGLSEQQMLIQKTVYNFAQVEILPNALKWEEESYFPIEAMKKAAELGLFGIFLDNAFGGSEMGALDSSLIFEGLSTGCLGTAGFISVQNLCNLSISKYGNKEQKDFYLQKLCNIQMKASFCLTEPDAGSDASNIKTIAKEDGGDFIINGRKTFITEAENADLHLVFCKTAEKEISCFLLEKENVKGVSFPKRFKKLGWNFTCLNEVNFENCRVSKRSLLGKRGEGLKIAMAGLDVGRINIASTSLGGAAFCLETTRDYIQTRKQFGKSLAEFQYLQFKYAEMATTLQAARLMVRNAAKLIDANDSKKGMFTAMAKTFATKNGFDIASNCMQMYGGYGYLKDYPIEKFFRDMRVNLIIEGSDEIMKLIISKNLLKD